MGSTTTDILTKSFGPFKVEIEGEEEEEHLHEAAVSGFWWNIVKALLTPSATAGSLLADFLLCFWFHSMLTSHRVEPRAAPKLFCLTLKMDEVLRKSGSEKLAK